jgi:hypothetical protein
MMQSLSQLVVLLDRQDILVASAMLGHGCL